MTSFVQVHVEGGVVVSVSTNVPMLEITVRDADAAEVGEPHTGSVPLIYTGPWDADPITDDERRRFFEEMEGNLHGSRTTAEILLNLIDEVPAARASFKEWLGNAERETVKSARAGDGTYGLTFYGDGGSIVQTAFCFDTPEHAEEVARAVFDRGSFDPFEELGIPWDPLYAWREPFTGATIETEDEDVKDIPRYPEEPHNPGPLTTAEYAIAASGGVPVTDDELKSTPDGRVHPDFGYVDGPQPEPDYDDGQPSDLQEHSDFAQDDLPEHDGIGECW